MIVEAPTVNPRYRRRRFIRGSVDLRLTRSDCIVRGKRSHASMNGTASFERTCFQRTIRRMVR